ncbi:MAG: HisS family protein [Chloroflexota bacterium]
MKAQRCKGTRDLSPAEMGTFRLIESIFRDSCLKWGYEEVRTPTLEYLHLFTSTGTLTPSRLHKVYSFLDWDGWSGERVVLRPDGTIPIARLFIDTMADKELAKLFYVANVFSFEETGTEAREKWQCGAELIGAGGSLADIELIIMAMEVLKKLGIDCVELKLSHAGLIKALLIKFGISHADQTKIFDQILDGDIEALAKLSPEKTELGKLLAPLFDLKGKAPGFLKNLKSMFNRDLPELELPLNNFIGTVDLLESLGYDYQIDIASGRGFEYYTGMMFQLLANGQHIGGGGRYDDLIPLLGGKPTPASGFALYLDYLMNLVKPLASAKPSSQLVLVKSETGALQEALNMINQLREANYQAELHLGQERTDERWELNIQTRPPSFILVDRAADKKYEAQTTDVILDLLEKLK